MTTTTAEPQTAPFLPHFPDAFLLAPADPDNPEAIDLNLRESGLGGSDIGALLNLDRFKDSLKVYTEKTGGPPERRSAQLDRSARRGHRLEGLIAELFAEETGHLITPSPGTLAHKRHPWMRANMDRLVFDPEPALLECKSRTWRSGKAEDWGGTEPPDGPTIQACWYMLVTGWRRAYVAGLIDDDFKWFVVERDEELLAHLAVVATRFWFDNVLARRPPPPSGLESTAELLSHLWDVKPGSIKIFDPDEVNPILAERRALKAAIKAAEEDVRALEGRLKMMLGDAEVAMGPAGPLFTWNANGTFSPKRFRAELPETAAAYTTQVDAIDLARIKAEQPEIYATYRARVFRDGTPA